VEGITIDGRLDDWPSTLAKHPIKNQLKDRDQYDKGVVRQGDDPAAYFMTGYNLEHGLIYLAVVVRDEELVVNQDDPWHTDSVEVYVDGLCSDRVIAPADLSQWINNLSASKMPVVQYVGLPGPGPAYGKSGGSNPALMYGKISHSATTMRYRRVGDVITYEWGVQAFDRYPDRPTRLAPGKSLGLEVAVVDKDSDRARPYFRTWGRPPRGFKGFDARQLGELILDAPP
jgi:hypothetical protein